MSKYTIEKHGDGYAIYLGRDWQHHGANIGHLTEVTPATIKLIQDALNATLAQDEPWDTSDMAYRPNGLSVEQEPVAWEKSYDIACALLRQAHDILATTQYPIKRPWVSLTDDEIDYLEDAIDPAMYRVFARRIEAKLKELNT